MTIWTPDGEHNPAPGETGGEAPELTPEQQEQAKEMAKQLADAREQIIAAEARDIIANHALGIYELAAIHLTAEEPKLDQAKLAIDALAALVEGLKGQLGDAEPILSDSLHQIRLGYVQRSQDQGEAPEA